MLKKIYGLIIMIILLGLGGIIPNIVYAADIQTATSTINGVTANWSYTLNDSNQIENLKCTNPEGLIGNITVPSTLNEKTVISIGSDAFKSATNITGVIIPNSIKSIKNGAFRNCTNIVSVDLAKLESIYFDAFQNCTALTEIKIPKTLKSDTTSAPFRGCTNLTKITLEEGLERVPTYLCANTPITEIIIPNSVKTISSQAFANCTNLTNVNLGNVESISVDAFQNCIALTEIKIPKTLKADALGAPFRGCTNLTRITLEEGLERVPTYLCANTQIAEITIPNSVTEIAVYAFRDCSNLKKITILDNVKMIGWESNQDSVFTNHNEDLTIYCYEGSTAAKYAIDYNIKYVYLPKQASESVQKEEKNPQSENTKSSDEKTTTKDSSLPNEKVTPNDTNVTTKKTTTDDSSLENTKVETEDKTTSTNKLPRTGVGIRITIETIILMVGSIIAYFKYNKLKGI